jgi:multidrug efflux pump subunit AcrA (membrane-fusion protein)
VRRDPRVWCFGDCRGLKMPRRLLAMTGVIVLGMVAMARTTPAWSASTCPTKPATPTTDPPNASVCGTERLEEEEERVEEELEAQEDEEEERAIAAERAARAASDATEEAAEEAAEAAQEQAAREKTQSSASAAEPTLKLQVRISRRRGHSRIRPGETRISVTTSIPAQVRVALQAHGGPVKLFRGESAGERKYVLRVPWTCRSQARRYTFTVTAHGEGVDRTGPGEVTVRHRTFAIPTDTACGKDQTHSPGH